MNHNAFRLNAEMVFLTKYLHIKTHFNITNVAIGNLYELEELFKNLKISTKCAVSAIYKERRLQVFFIVQVFL